MAPVDFAQVRSGLYSCRVLTERGLVDDINDR